MSGRYLWDTNIVIALFANDTTITNRLIQAGEFFIPAIVIGELRYGAYKSGQTMKNLARINEFVAENIVLSCDVETTDWYGQIKDKLRRKGRPIPENDIWIAAIAQQYQLVLVTRDGHFEQVEDLMVEMW